MSPGSRKGGGRMTEDGLAAARQIVIPITQGGINHNYVNA
jgi:hypothetical protein